uniref:ZP domain-containing protein n=1 Tax=Caenorhabditis japonica TaxID=281687 RepID=A0A8R1I5R6_CAEJA
MFFHVIVLSALVVVTVAFHVGQPTKNTVADAKDQEQRFIQCWESESGELRLSQPIYELCSYMPDPFDDNIIHVNGVDPESDDYSNVMALFDSTVTGHAMLQVCLQEAFQFHTQSHPSQTSLRCLCKRSGCNLSKPMPQNFKYNSLPMPDIY